MTLYAAIDLHSNNRVLSVIDAQDQVVFERLRRTQVSSIALSVDREGVVFGGYAYASSDGSYYGSVRRLRLYAWI